MAKHTDKRTTGEKVAGESEWSIRYDLGPGPIHLDLGRRSRRRASLLTPLAVFITDPEVVLGVLMEIFRGYRVTADRRFPGEGDVTLEYLIGVAADFEAGAVAVEGLISLRSSMLLLKWPLAVKAPARTLI